jgi:dihydropteroate synthase
VSTVAAARDLVFGATARALGPRVLEVRPASESGLASEVRVAFRSGALPAHAHTALTDMDGARFEPPLPEGGDERATLTCPRSALEAAAEGLEEARVLLAAVRCFERRPAAPRLMGVINVTPDSFSDGGETLDAARAVERGLLLEREGADLLDIGGESTRPGAEPVAAEQELQRVLPVVEGLARSTRAQISVDTTKAVVARACLDAGATLINDVSAGRADPGMLPLVAESGCDYIAMHMRGDPLTMQRAPRYEDSVAEVCEFLRDRVAACLQAGVELQRMILDPGIGFGKRLRHNLDLLQRLPELRSLGRPLCLGVSRKSFIAHATGKLHPEDWEGNRPTGTQDRLAGSAAAVCVSVLGGAEILRVHEVAQMAEATAIALGVSRRGLLGERKED